MTAPRIIPFDLDRMRRLNYTWFSPGATRFFANRYPRTALETDTAIWFVTSTTALSSARRWTVHRMSLQDHDVTTIGSFGEHASSKAAWAALRKAEIASRGE